MTTSSSPPPGEKKNGAQYLDVPRQAWRIRGQARDYLIVSSQDLTADETGACVSTMSILAELGRWLSSLTTRRMCVEWYERLTGTRGSELLLHRRPLKSVQLEKTLTEAFRHRRLVALPLSPLRVRKRIGGEGAPPSPAQVPVPLLPDASPPPPQSAPSAPAGSASPASASAKDTKKVPMESATVAFTLLDQFGKPVGGARYLVTLPDGRQVEGRLDAQGYARLTHVEEGPCTIGFPDLDASGGKAALTTATSGPVVFRQTASGSVQQEPRTLSRVAYGKDESSGQRARGWVAIELVDQDGKPVGGVRYRVVLPDGQVREGRLDAQGYARVDSPVEGSCKVSFPDLDANSWSAGS